MAHANLILALSLIATSSVAAANVDSPGEAAPPGTPSTKYCMRVEAETGSRIETVRCWTREEWAEQGVDVDKDWAKEGVAVQG